MREQEGNQIIDIFFAHQNPVVFRHGIDEAFHHLSAWVQDGLPEVFHGGQPRNASTGALGDALE